MTSLGVSARASGSISRDKRGDAKAFGIGLLAVGMMIAIAALFMSTSVTTDTAMTYYGRTSAHDVYNLGLLQHQMMVFVGGLGVAIAGVVVASAGTIIEHLVPVAPTAAIKAVPPSRGGRLDGANCIRED